MSRTGHLMKRIFAVLLCLCLLLTLTGCSTEGRYQSANKLLAKGEYEKAAEKLEALGSFEDAPLLTMYAKAAAAGENGQYTACLQAFETLGDFKDSQLMYSYYMARSWEAAGLSAATPKQQAGAESWESLMRAAELYGQQLLFRDSQQRQQNCLQATYDMAEGLADAEYFAAARDAHNALAEEYYKDSRTLGKYYAARYNESLAPQGIAYGDQWSVSDFQPLQSAAAVYDEISYVRDSLTRAEACRKTAYDFAKLCAAEGDYTNASKVAAYAAGYSDADNLTLYYAACAKEAAGEYAAAASQLAALGDYAPEGMESGTAHANTALQTGYDAAMALLEGGSFDEGYTLLRTLGDYNDAIAYPPKHQFERADAHLEAGEYAEAVVLFDMIDVQARAQIPGCTEEQGEIARQRMEESYYRWGEALFAAAQTQEDYDTAELAFYSAGSYTPEGGVPAEQRYASLWYERGESLLVQETPDYDGAKKAFLEAADYAPEGSPDGSTAAKRAMYLKGESLLAQETPDYDGAKKAFLEAADYAPEGGPDGFTAAKRAMYLKGESLLAQETPDYDGAWEAFRAAENDAPEGGLDGYTAAKRAMYLKGESLLAQSEPDYEGARKAFSAAADYTPEGGLDGYTAAKRAMYLKGEALLAQSEPDFPGATQAFRQAGEYAPEGGANGTERVRQVWMLRGELLLTQPEPDYHGAWSAFTNAGGEEGTARAQEAKYLEGNHLVAEGRLGEALFAYRAARNHSRAMEKAAVLQEQFRNSINAGMDQAAWLKTDGTVLQYGDSSSFANLSVFRDMISVTTGGRYYAGLKANGTVLAAGFAPTGWTDMRSVVSGEKFVLGLKNDGTLLISEGNVLPTPAAEWKDLAAVDVSYNTIIALKKNGTVAASQTGMDGEGGVQKWNGITQIAAGGTHTVGLKKDGTVVAVGDNSQRQCNTEEWSNIVAVAAGSYHTVGLRADGTVVAVGWRNHGQLRVDTWSDVVAIAAAGTYTMGLKADGTILFTGQMDYDECDFSHLTDIGPNVAYVQQLLGE